MIYVVWGQSNYGKVDKVGDFCYVATQFGHLWYIPIIPIQTYIVIAGSESGNGFKGIPIEMSAKSILMGWLRAGLIIGTPILFILALVATVEALEPRPRATLDEALLKWALLAVSIPSIWLSYRLSHASVKRAMQLADHLGMSRLVMLKMILSDRTDEELATQAEEPQWDDAYNYRESGDAEDR